MKQPPTHAPTEGIVVHELMALGGVRQHSIRGVAVGFDEAGSPVSKLKLDDLSDAETKRLRALLVGIIANIDRGGAQLH